MPKGDDRLTDEERRTRRRMSAGKRQTGKAFDHLDALRSIMKQTGAKAATRDFTWWCNQVGRSRIPEMMKVSRTIRAHWDGMVAYLHTRVTNGAAEALNGVIQTLKRKSWGFRSVEHFVAMIYPVAFKLEFDLPDPIPSTHPTSH